MEVIKEDVVEDRIYWLFRCVGNQDLRQNDCVDKFIKLMQEHFIYDTKFI